MSSIIKANIAAKEAVKVNIIAGISSDADTVDGKHASAFEPTLAAGPTFGHVHLTSGQVGFPATQVPSADVNTLDDYEEGAWTPIITFGGASVGVTYGVHEGYYTKIGNMVTVQGLLTLSSKGSSVGVALLGGLPFNSATEVSVALCLFHVSFADFPEAYISNGANYICLQESTNAGVVSQLTNTDFSDDSYIIINCTYKVT